ncbi:16S rRNA (cytosine(967)-C(5))-methyltransferase RsmB [Staphylococcus sp. SQ8-PEA]|uniref:16S rRNA (cytosine(967)-C(5))-methyltransferase n=1 Tax=Staphylococcus marylandisciuri TaxID=2981529 RepID=A0ABT2QP58_9STAP|nr:16S rRNA (cytosine(967)-C(5))-methyltransferase RsmB [Staphylococcus marylandisciuri]MCU5745748.1 16S rRNA (cytosine(967)-C(5))-methyltransferase RsmB [Staphylococcus marylandisciuri]
MTKDVSVRNLTFNTLEHVLNNKAYSNLAINQVLNQYDLSVRDKSLFTELVYGTLKRKLTLEYHLKPFLKTKVKRWVRILLWMSIYQLYYLDKIPAHAVINEAVEIAKRHGGHHQSKIVNGILRTMTRTGLSSLEDIKDDNKRLSVTYSVPLWIVKHWVTHHGFATTERIAQAMLENPGQTVRVNTAKTTVERVSKLLNERGFQVKLDQDIPECLHVVGGSIIQEPVFTDGLVSIQDKSSMFVARYLDLENDNRVLDTCSAPGGKACHIAELLNHTGKVTATDIHEHKINLIEHNIAKLGLDNIDALQHDATQSYQGTYDRILVDAPCSGLGVLRHKPEIKYEQSQVRINTLVDLQLEILNNVKSHLKPGGKLVYSTCTIEQLENENVIYTFLKQNKDFEFDPIEDPRTHQKVKTLQILPQDFNSDGFFITRIRRKDS